MDGLLFLLIIGVVVLYRMGAKKRSALRRQITSALGGTSTRPSPRRRPRRSSLPPPSNPQPPPPRPIAAAPEPIEVVEADVAPGPMEPVVIDVPEPQPEARPEPTPDPEPTSAPTAISAPDLDLSATIQALFLDRRNAQDRLDAFESTYAGHEVEWTAEVVRASNSRRHGDAALRVELFLGYASENEFHSDRVLAEAYFPPGAALERGTTVTFRGTLADANVFARRVVLDDARLV